MITVEGNMGSRAHTEAEFWGTREALLARAQESALRIHRSHLRTSTDEAVEVVVGMSLRSWGEVVRITAREHGQVTLLHIESRSRVAITLVDWGKNRRNVETVLEGL
jgi:hypothetical protein